MNADGKRALGRVFWSWWSAMTDASNGGANRDRADIARLARVDLVGADQWRTPDVIAALSIERFRELCHKIEPAFPLHDLKDDRAEDLVTAAVVLARIRESASGSVAQALGGAEDKDRRLKEGRFLALMRVQTSADLFDQARRLPDLLGNAAPVGDLGASLILWRREPWVRRDWARQYYHLDLRRGAPAPTQDPDAAAAAVVPGA
jgi:hypothetical protein